MTPTVFKRSAVRLKRAGAILVAAFVCVAVFDLGGWLGIEALGGVAHAQLTYHLRPALGVGITDNAAYTPTGQGPQRDEFGTVNLTFGGHYERALVAHNLDAAVLYTRYLEGHGEPALTAALTWNSLFRLSAGLDLGIAAYVALSQTVPVNGGDLTVVTPTATGAGQVYFLNTVVSQTLSYQPTPRRLYFESLAVSQGRYLETTPGLPSTTTVISARLRASRIYARDRLYLELLGTDQLAADVTPVAGTTVVTPFSQGQTFMAELMAGWEHDLGAVWTTLAAAGPMVVFQVGGPYSFGPAAVAGVTYHRRTWFASLIVSQTPAPNLYIGAMTLNDEAFLRLALPLTRSERVFIAGFASYTYARVPTNQLDFTRAYDEETAGASLTAQAKQLPLAAGLQYTINVQHGGTAQGISAPDLERQVLMLTVTGLFAWGPGTAPLFRGGSGL